MVFELDLVWAAGGVNCGYPTQAEQLQGRNVEGWGKPWLETPTRMSHMHLLWIFHSPTLALLASGWCGPHLRWGPVLPALLCSPLLKNKCKTTYLPSPWITVKISYPEVLQPPGLCKAACGQPLSLNVPPIYVGGSMVPQPPFTKGVCATPDSVFWPVGDILISDHYSEDGDAKPGLTKLPVSLALCLPRLGSERGLLSHCHNMTNMAISVWKQHHTSPDNQSELGVQLDLKSRPLLCRVHLHCASKWNVQCGGTRFVKVPLLEAWSVTHGSNHPDVSEEKGWLHWLIQSLMAACVGYGAWHEEAGGRRCPLRGILALDDFSDCHE